MNGSIIVSEDRSVVDKLKNWYKNKFLTTSDDLGDIELAIDKKAKIDKKNIKILGISATVLLYVCPLDGYFGEILALAATPLALKLADVKSEFLKKSYLGKGNYVQFFDEDGNYALKDVPNFDLFDAYEDENDLGREVKIR